ncbi:TonB-dependent receptor [Wenyingzhuangia sp. chi5]|uniref:TonB-dependent receptor n=1 Tax=Wenyingzhuangia gilva TaxID=3057677 RepID=A0ABT8VTU6_9FLAO|nr:TonB-dependent receptor [Wenyingzhuangia sp. chi5]MDO3695350.1 TonB-dependent receptor [Wenyingzhuangia sp. chi5]
MGEHQLHDFFKASVLRKYLLPLCLLLSMGFVQAQSKVVWGTVTGQDNTPLLGVNITIVGLNKGTNSDFDGNYQIEVSPNQILRFEYLGYQAKEVTFDGSSVINVVLKTSTEQLNEVVVVGYGTQKKKVSTAATSVVGGDDIVQTASLGATSAIQGQTTGVSISASSGQPGAAMVVNIRGVGTAGNSNPLYVVDGVVVDNGIDYLDSSIIERIDILKDASAASIYGARAANGVVLVTTKKGKDGKMNVSFNSYAGFQHVYKKLDLLSTKQYAMIMNEARVNTGLAPAYSNSQIASMSNHDWQDDLFNNGALKQNHSLLISGGDEKATYSTGLSYYGQEGLIGSKTGQSDYDRITFTANATYNVIKDHLKIGENFSFANINSSGVSDDGVYNNSIRGFLNAPPTMSAYDANGNFAGSSIASDITNPLGSLYYNNFNENKINRVVGNVFAEGKFLNGFTFKTSFGVDINNSNYRSFSPIYQLSTVGYNTVSSVTQSANNGTSWIWENTLQYDTTINDVHNINVLLGTSARKGVYQEMSATGKNLIFSDFKHAYLSNATDKEQNTVSGKRTDYSIQSYFGRLLYDYDNKYLFTATIRRDGSSEFGANNKYAIFPAFSAGWNLDEESFFPQNDIVSKLKLRASWGQNGNDQFSKAFAYMSTISSYDKNYHFGTGESEIPLQTGASPDAISNPNLKWETSEQWDLGFDAKIFTSLNLTFDYYHKTTKDWLVQAAVPDIAGADAPFINGGDILNKGVELGLNYKTRVNKDLFITVNGNISFNNNEVLRIDNANGIIYGDPNLLFQGMDEMNRVQEGYPIGYFYGLKTKGLFQNQAEIDQYAKNGTLIQPNAKPGDVRFLDLNDDGKIDQNDKSMIGDPNPDFQYGINFTANYKAFDFSVYTYGVGGNQNTFGVHDYSRPYNNYTTRILNRWTSEGTSNTIPRVTYGTTENGNYNKFSDLYVQDAGFFRIKAVNLGCDLAKLTDGLKMFSKFRLYVTANNLFTFTNYQGMDPEIGFGNVNQSWARGVDVGFYPQPRTYLLGLNVNF